MNIKKFIQRLFKRRVINLTKLQQLRDRGITPVFYSKRK
jgi:hypothetical protein